MLRRFRLTSPVSSHPIRSTSPHTIQAVRPPLASLTETGPLRVLCCPANPPPTHARTHSPKTHTPNCFHFPAKTRCFTGDKGLEKILAIDLPLAFSSLSGSYCSSLCLPPPRPSGSFRFEPTLLPALISRSRIPPSYLYVSLSYPLSLPSAAQARPAFISSFITSCPPTLSHPPTHPILQYHNNP